MLSYNIASKQANKDEEGQSTAGGGGGGASGGRKTSSSLRPPEQILKCPRCDSANTKFCYYNNYSLAQPRHFCKACRRYWTKGGALRSVPIGGSCRKNKKTKSCSSRYFIGESSSKGSSSDIGGMKYYGLSTLDFNLGGSGYPPRVTTNNQFSSSYVDTSSNPSFVNLDPLGFHLPFSSSHSLMKQGDHHQQQQQHNQSGGGLASLHEIPTYNHLHHHSTALASSIESLSSINQDLHWKLQQQRLAMLFGGGGGGDGDKESDHHQQQKKLVDFEPPAQKLQPILFQNLEISKPAQSFIDGDPRKDMAGGASGLATEWFFDNSYAPSNLNPETSTNSNSAGNDQNGSINHWNGIQNWNQLN